MFLSNFLPVIPQNLHFKSLRGSSVSFFGNKCPTFKNRRSTGAEQGCRYSEYVIITREYYSVVILASNTLLRVLLPGNFEYYSRKTNVIVIQGLNHQYKSKQIGRNCSTSIQLGRNKKKRADLPTKRIRKTKRQMLKETYKLRREHHTYGRGK